MLNPNKQRFSKLSPAWLQPDNRLFELARSGRRQPHWLVVIIFGFAFILASQALGGIAAGATILALKAARGALPPLDTPAQLMNVFLIETALEQTLLLVLGFGPLFLLLWLWLAAVEKRGLWTIGLERGGIGRKYLRGLGIGLAMFAATVGLSAMPGYLAFEPPGAQPQGVAAIGGVLLVLLGWTVQGAAEEALARGWILPALGARYTPLLGVLMSAILFAVFHSFNPHLNPIAVLNLFLFGLFTALFALYEGGLWGVFAIHTAWNWAQGNLFGLAVSGVVPPGGTLFNLMEVGPDVITGGAFGPEGGLAVTTVLVISCIIVWRAAQRHS